MIKKNIKAYGSKERREKHKHRKLAIYKHVDYLISRFLPELNKQIVNIQKERYLTQLTLLIEALEKKYTSFYDYRIANNYLATSINDGNKKKKCLLEVPAYITHITREAPLRTEKWFTTSRELNNWEKKWQSSIESSPATQPKQTEEELLSAVLISAALYGGLCLSEAIVALANQLNNIQVPLNVDANKCWIDLVFISGSQACNVRVDDNCKTLRRWYPDPISLTRIYHFLSIKSAPSLIPKRLTKDTCWKRMRAYLVDIDDEKGKKFKNFNLFCKAAIGVVENSKGVYINEAMVEYAVGKVPSASLPTSFQTVVTQNSVFNGVAHKPLDNYKQSSSNPKKQKRQSPKINGYESIIYEIRQAIRPKLSSGVKNTVPKATTALELLLNETQTMPLEILISWFVFLFENKILKKVSSAYQYFSLVGKEWILGTLNCDLYAFDESDFQNLYTSLLDSETMTEKISDKVDRFEQLHQFAHRDFGLEYMDSIYPTNERKRKKSYVRAGFITENAFAAFIYSIQLAEYNDSLAKEGLILLYVIAFRAGIRRGELLKLRLKDIEHSDESWLYIRNNKYGDNKSTSASRKIPLSLLLTLEEKAQFDQYLRKKLAITKNHQNALLFSLSQTTHIPLDGGWVSSIAKDFLHEITKLPIVFHHFRHSALSRIQVVLENDTDLIEKLTAYTPQQVINIQSIFGSLDQAQNKRDLYWALAGIAGHLTPETTFAHYLHFSDRLLANKIDTAKRSFSASAIREISGLSSHSITRTCNSKFLDQDDIQLNNFQPLLLERLKPFAQKIIISSNSKTNSPMPPVSTPFETKKTIELCHAVLKQVEQGASLYELSRHFYLDESVITSWITQAQKIAALTTSKNKSRVFSKDKALTVIKDPLAPALPQSKAELIDAGKAIKILRSIYKEQEREINWCIHYLLNNTNTSSSGLTFTSPKDLKRFLKISMLVFPINRWRLRLKLLKSSSDAVQIKKWQTAYKKYSLEIKKENVQRKSVFPYGKLELYLKHPIEKKRIDDLKKNDKGEKCKKYSTNTLRYIFHMIAIMKSK